MGEHRMPAEWAPQEALWVGWPWDRREWGPHFDGARAEIADLVAALADPHPETSAFDRIDLVTAPGEGRNAAETEFEAEIAEGRVRIIEAPIGDVWLRDTGPIVRLAADGRSAAGFAFNGWGGKYVMGEDARIAEILAGDADLPFHSYAPFVFEGGAIEVDGEGTAITTRRCVLNPNRNPGLAEADVEQVLQDALGIERVLWLDDGLAFDHTDGHVDNVVRFLATGLVAVQRSTGADDPNAALFAEVAKTLAGAVDAGGRAIRFVDIPSPGRIETDGEPVAASHMNFVISNGLIAAPHYVEAGGDERAAEEAFDLLMDAGPRERGVMLPSHNIVGGGGSFHCITQQRPR
ncbi:MAG: agmatine deiminase family protein [Pseudomonadota bacterium]